MTADGSPTPRKKSSIHFTVHEDQDDKRSPPVLGNSGGKRTNPTAPSESALPLTTSTLANQQSRAGSLRISKKQKTDSSSTAFLDTTNTAPMDQLLAKLREQQSLIAGQQQSLSNPGAIPLNLSRKDSAASSSESIPVTPHSDKYITTPTSGSNDGSERILDEAEMLRLMRELEAAKSQIARMDQELAQSRITKHTLDQAMGPPSEVDFPMRYDHDIGKLQNVSNAATRASGVGRTWSPLQEDARSGVSDALAAGPYNRNPAIWANGVRPCLPSNIANHVDQQYPMPLNHNVNLANMRPWFNGNQVQGMNLPCFAPAPQTGRPVPPPLRIDPSRANMPFQEPTFHPIGPSFRRPNNVPSRPDSAFEPQFGGWGSYPASIMSTDAMGVSPPPTPLSYQSMAMYPPQTYQPQPVGTHLSPMAVEFSSRTSTPWNAQPSQCSGSNYMAIAEPVNYKQLLDNKNLNCDWKYIVDKIVCSNDQQASIFLQQKLKVGTQEQKFEIVEAIIAQAYPLMINRFGNFLVQRCFEHGTQEQIIAIANAIRGNTLNLSMDSFGCHVIQKAFDAVPEEYKAIMVHELLRRIPETVIHRYACHVWQKLFELRWSDSPPQIMKYVNEALRGMWHEVALGETGSLVVQNIFENCLEEDKRPCINEVLASIDVVAHGQFGNWCIQHICEHGAPVDRSRAIDHILRFATEYSMDQYASKVIEKCLKIGGNDFLDRYLGRVCEVRPDRPRIPLIDIAGDQFGNYLIQYILSNSSPQHRDIVASHVRKHMVSLRGSKYGSRVAMLCCNPAYTTRPGPPAGMQLQRFSSHGSHASSGRGGYGAYR